MSISQTIAAAQLQRLSLSPLDVKPEASEFSLRQRLWAAVELLLASALVVGANVFDVVPVTETPWLVMLGWLSLRLRGLTWHTLGLRRPRNWITTTAVALVAGIGLQLISEFVTEPIIERITGQTPDLSDFRSLVGNLPATLGWLALVWTLAAFGEEMAYRGYVLERAATLGHRSSSAYFVAMVVVSLLFGLGHFYQGVAGLVGSTFSGLFFGALFLASGRNLWLPILAHGFSDTIGLVLVYLGLVPELRG
ncbi:MAG: CPBP family intramembrane glutamic endopeptidase [Steroidobacteraceae bacterium]